jgi:hypothetical protein
MWISLDNYRTSSMNPWNCGAEAPQNTHHVTATGAEGEDRPAALAGRAPPGGLALEHRGHVVTDGQRPNTTSAYRRPLMSSVRHEHPHS